MAAHELAPGQEIEPVGPGSQGAGGIGGAGIVGRLVLQLCLVLELVVKAIVEPVVFERVLTGAGGQVQEGVANVLAGRVRA